MECLRELHRWVRKIKKPILDVEDVEEILTTNVKKLVLLVDLENLKRLEDTAGKIKNLLQVKD